MSSKKERILLRVLFIYLLCFGFRILEYFVLRTDETFWGEAVVHKLIGIAILLAAIKYFKFTSAEIGFSDDRVWKNLLRGLTFGLLVFIPAYLVEIVIVMAQDQFERVALYVSAYTISGTGDRQTALFFFAICIMGNIINVIMEEGIFRGLFRRILEKRYPFAVVAVVSSCLFGFWHIMAPLRGYYDGTLSFNGFLANAVLLLFSSGLVGFQYAVMTKLTNSLYMAMGHHFINNTIVNILHVISKSGSDEWMTIRIAIAQSLSFVIILVWYFLVEHKARIRYLD